VSFSKTNDRIADVLTVIRDDLIPWAEADVEASQEAGACAQAADDLARLMKLKQAERLLEECWK
jgi:hypothetical protein